MRKIKFITLLLDNYYFIILKIILLYSDLIIVIYYLKNNLRILIILNYTYYIVPWHPGIQWSLSYNVIALIDCFNFFIITH